MKKRNDIDSIVKKIANEQNYVIIKLPKDTKDKVIFLNENGEEIKQNFYNSRTKILQKKKEHLKLKF